MSMDRKIENKGKKWRRLAWISVSAVLAVLVFYQIVFGDKSSRLNVEIDKITVEQVREEAFLDFIAVIGTVEPIQTIFLDATEGGRVEEIYRREGGMVEVDEPLARLSNTTLLLDISNHETNYARTVNDMRMFRVQLEQQNLSYRNQLLELELALRQHERRYRNNKVLMEQNHISREDYEISKEQYEISRRRLDLYRESYEHDSIYRLLQIDAMETSLRNMEENMRLVYQRLEAMELRAPVYGELATLNLEIGQMVNRGERLGRINILDSYKLRVEIDEHYISRVTQGLKGDFEFAGSRYDLVITRIYPEVQAGRFSVDMEFVNGVPDQLRIGQTFRIRLELGESRTAILIPRGGFYQSTGGQWVYVVDPSGSYAIRRDIRIGRQNPRFYEVLEGLYPGERVIVSSYDNFGNVDRLVLR
ncbi:MAG: HlyD family efflux transporter periplasmic adaptor subunit [Marinilabiliales bacterium]|nr:MAG: HlyD family efflux transporter periplasmic adaptor subunit [Marinilabiliales bacterium]